MSDLLHRESIPIIPIWTTIRTFSEIKMKPNTIILCDIDDTLLHHPAFNHTWINIIHSLFYEHHFSKNTQILGRTSCSTFDDSKENRSTSFLSRIDAIKIKAETDAKQFCDEVLRNMPIRHTDRNGFFDMVSKSTAFAFITARQLSSKDFTYANLRSIDVEPEQYKVHFSGHSPKGEYIRSHFDLSKYEHVVFIDDQPHNLTNVYDVITHRGLELYQFKYEIDVPLFEYYPFPPIFNGQFWFDGTTTRKFDK